MRRWTFSLRWRWLIVTLVALTLAMALAGVLLVGLFREHALRQFDATLVAQLDQITAYLEFDAAGRPRIDPQALSDPRWSRPYSGLYWQLDALPDAAGQAPARGVLRSRSLWDAVLPVRADALADGVVHMHELSGPNGAHLRIAQRSVWAEGVPQRWRLVVAADRRPLSQAERHFTGTLAVSLALLLALLSAAAVAQVAVGLAPLRALQRALAAVRQGRTERLQGRFPAEVQPLIDQFNGVLDRNAQFVARARTQAGNLAHAIKTPLSVMAQGAEAAARQPETAAALPALVREQVGLAQRHIDWHLARSRAAAAHHLPGVRTPLTPLVSGLRRVLERAHAAREVQWIGQPIDPGLAFAGEAQDLQEILGNVLDNACKWARTQVRGGAVIEAGARGPRLRIVVDDDGPGIDAEQRDAVMARGARIDESVPGSGLGLSIMQELAQLCGGAVALQAGPLGGLRVVLDLPSSGP
jgi:signal transduction histidine kinase